MLVVPVEVICLGLTKIKIAEHISEAKSEPNIFYGTCLAYLSMGSLNFSQNRLNK